MCGSNSGFDFPGKEYDSFTNSISRFKWTIIITILLSCSAILHIYSENGFSSAQRKYIVQRKIFSDSIEQVLKIDKEKAEKVYSIDLERFSEQLKYSAPQSEKTKSLICSINNYFSSEKEEKMVGMIS